MNTREYLTIVACSLLMVFVAAGLGVLLEYAHNHAGC